MPVLPRFIIPSVAALALAFSVGTWIGRATDANAQKLDQRIFDQYVSQARIKEVADSIRDDMRWQRQDEKWDDALRMWKRVMCRIYKECER